jgi:hypothetical protein
MNTRTAGISRKRDETRRVPMLPKLPHLVEDSGGGSELVLTVLES